MSEDTTDELRQTLVEQLTEVKSLLHDVKNNVFLLDLNLVALGQKLEKRSIDEALELLKLSKVSIDRIRRVVLSGSEARARVPVSEVLLQVVEEYRDKSTSIYCDFQQGEKFVSIKYTDLLRIFQNLVKNAFEAMGKVHRKRLELSVRLKNKQVTVAIYNNGPVIPARLNSQKKLSLAYIFETGFTTKGSGDGLGLGTVKRLVRVNGGQVRVRNRREGGAEFSIIFPEAMEESLEPAV